MRLHLFLREIHGSFSKLKADCVEVRQTRHPSSAKETFNFCPRRASKCLMNLGSHRLVTLAALCTAILPSSAAPERDLSPFLQKHCVECHDADTKKGDLDLTALKFDFSNSTNFSKWVTVHDRVASGEMPPKKKARPDAKELPSSPNRWPAN